MTGFTNAFRRLRVSIDRYNASKSPLRQARNSAKWLAAHGYRPVEVIVERGVSGMAPYDAQEERKLFHRLTQRAESAEFGTRGDARTDVDIVCESYDRFCRSATVS